ncbi:hypothetical protein D3C77_678410 [compost metagenome]
MLHESSAVPAAVLFQGRAGVQAILVPIATEQQVVALVEAQVVLPVDRVTVGVELATAWLQCVALGVAVLAVAQFQA